jgi:hypothetical protein
VVVCKAACWEGGLLSMLALPGMLMSCAPEWCAPEGGGKERVREEGGGRRERGMYGGRGAGGEGGGILG